jgi:hypothetical protein
MLKLALSVVVCFASALLAAQQSSSGTPATSSPTSQQENSSPQSAEKSIRGCLSGAPGTFTLTEDRSGTVFALAGNADMLSSHVGHEIEVTGQATTGGSSATQSSGGTAHPPKGAVGTAPINTYQVNGVRVLSDHCGTGSVTGPSE